MDLKIIKFFESIRNPIFDWFFYIITYLGDELFFIVLATVIYWTIDKKFAFKFSISFMFSALINTVLKGIVKRPRPYLHEGITQPNLPGVETSGYSFPSGHSQAIGVIGYSSYNAYEQTNKKRWLILSIVIPILVMISRVYLMQHFLSDTIVGVLIGFFVALGIFKLIDLMNDKEEFYFLPIILIVVILMFFSKNDYIFVAGGGISGFLIGYPLEKHYVRLDVKKPFRIQVLKVILGLLVIFAIKEGLKLILVDNLYTTFIRYFLMGIWASILAPIVFKYAFDK